MIASHPPPAEPASSSVDRPRAVAERRMTPKEHGAYGQLGFPLIVALSLGRIGLLSIGLAIASVAAFMAHEPLLLVLGQRGKRAQQTDAPRAWSKLSYLAVVGGLGALPAAYWGSATVRYVLLANVSCVLVALLLILRGKERSLFGELWIAFTLPSAAVPIALLNGMPLGTGLVLGASFVLAYVSGILGVKAIIADFKHGSKSAGWLGLLLVGVLTATLCLFARQAAASAALFWAVVCVCRAIRPSPKSLRTLGWLLVGTSVVQAVWLWLALRQA